MKISDIIFNAMNIAGGFAVGYSGDEIDCEYLPCIVIWY